VSYLYKKSETKDVLPRKQIPKKYSFFNSEQYILSTHFQVLEPSSVTADIDNVLDSPEIVEANVLVFREAPERNGILSWKGVLKIDWAMEDFKRSKECCEKMRMEYKFCADTEDGLDVEVRDGGKIGLEGIGLATPKTPKKQGDGKRKLNTDGEEDITPRAKKRRSLGRSKFIRY
jgi:hypothetical protein